MSEETIRVLLVDDIADTIDQLEKLLFFEKDIEVVGKANNGNDAVDIALQLRPNVVLMDINMPGKDGIAATGEIVGADPAIGVIIMSVQGETDYLRSAMRAGASEFLIKPVSADDLYKSIRSVAALAQSRGHVSTQASVAADAASALPTDRGHLFAVYSPKGGVGTSTMAANVAIALHQITKKKVALVDGNAASLGDLNVLLNLSSNRTIVDLIDRVADLDGELLNSIMTAHASQIKVLLAPPNPQDGELVTADHMRPILKALTLEYDYVIVDTESSFHDRALAVLDAADRIVVLMTLEMTCIKNIKLFMEVADLLEYPREKIVLVLNKADPRLGIRVENVESHLKHKVMMQIANAPLETSISINQGVPVVIGKRDIRVTKDIFVLARELARMTDPNGELATVALAATPAATAASAAVAPAAGRDGSAGAKKGGLLSRFLGRNEK